jgi:hypothetical protein
MRHGGKSASGSRPGAGISPSTTRDLADCRRVSSAAQGGRESDRGRTGPCVQRARRHPPRRGCQEELEGRGWKDRRRGGIATAGIPVLRTRAEGRSPAEPILWLEGGPGLSNMKPRPLDGLLATHDIVAIGYRGVDGSVKLDSPEIRRAMRGVGSDLLPCVACELRRCDRRSARLGCSRRASTSLATRSPTSRRMWSWRAALSVMGG